MANVTTTQHLASARFVAEGQRRKMAHGGQPKAAIEVIDGREQIVFTYPDGTRTCGGVVIGGK